MAWVYLIAAGLFEMLGITGMHAFHRDRSWRSLCFMMSSFSISFVLLSLAMATLPMGTAYAVWTGIGAAGGAVLGIIFYGESRDPLRVLSITMILGATIGLKAIT